MTVQDVDSEVTFTGNGSTTSFPFTFKCDDVAWLTLSYLVNFDQILLNGNQDTSPGGSVEYLAAPPLDQSIVLSRNVPLTQIVDYTRYGPFDSESHEDALDKLTMAIQDTNKNTALKSKSVTMENPDAAEDITLFYTPVEMKVYELAAVLVGASTPSSTWTLRYDPDRSAVGTEIIVGGTATTDLTTGDKITTFDNDTIPAGSWVWMETTAQSGVVSTLNITIRYKESL
jgi:hypothetical protein